MLIYTHLVCGEERGVIFPPILTTRQKEKKDMNRIEERVDQLLEQKTRQRKLTEYPQQRKHSIGINKKKALTIISAFFVFGTIVTGLGFADVFSYYVLEGTTIDANVLYTWDDQTAEDLIISKTITNAAGGNVYTYDHYLNLSSNADSNRTASFAWDNIPEGITTNLTVDGVEINYIIIEPGESIVITETITLDEKLIHDNYSYNLTVS